MDGAAPDLSHQHVQTLLLPEKKVADSLHERVAQELRRFWQAFESQIARSRQDQSARAIHRVRIAAKRLRYLTEVIREFEVPGSAETVAWLRRLQQHLGDWQDLEVLEQMMIEMVARPDFLSDHLELAMGVEKLILRHRRMKRGFEEKFFEMTQDSLESERLKEWVAYLLASPPAAFARA